jgi:glycerol-3-phosphate cytidylyltransferase
MKKGCFAGNFDVIHAGYIYAFAEAKQYCDHLTILLHTDPSIERASKLRPVHNLQERIDIVSSIKFVNSIIPYTYEEELYDILKDMNFDIRFLGEDYKDRTDYTGYDLNIPIHFIDRNHGWSTTKFKTLIGKSLN